MSVYIAGHTFGMTPNGRRCIANNNSGQLCYRSWLSIRDTTADQIGKSDIAHSGILNMSEFTEIECERKREIKDVWAAVMDAASAGTR